MKHRAKKKVSLLVCCPLYPPRIGGLEQHAEQWNKKMALAGYGILVWTPYIAGGAAREEGGHVTIMRFPAWQIIPNYPIPKFWHPLFWSQWRELTALLKAKNSKLETDYIIVSRTRFFITSLLALITSKNTRTPWLHIEHGSDFVHLKNWLASRLAYGWDHTIGRLVFQSADAVVAVSEAAAKFIKRFAPRRAVYVIYRGVDKKKLDAIAPHADVRQRHTGKVVLMYAGRLIDGKGVADLIKAIELLQNHYMLPSNGYNLLIIGDGPQRTKLEQRVVHAQLQNIITFTGEKPWPQAMSLLKAADIVINPSYTEGLPTILIEAALCQKAIVATDVGGTNEIITHGLSGYLVPAHNPEILAQTIEKLVKDPLRRKKLARNAYIGAVKKFDWHTAIEEYQKICAEL